METETDRDMLFALEDIDFEREFGAFDVASLFPPIDFIHDHFVGFFTIIKDGFLGSPPITSTCVPSETQEQVIRTVARRNKQSTISSFYDLTHSAFIWVAQIVFQLSYAITHSDLEVLAIFQHQLSFTFLLYCVYYGVEHYILRLPKNACRIPATALSLCFTKGLNKLGAQLALDNNVCEPHRNYTMTVPSGANMITINYSFEDPIHIHKGCPFDRNRSFTMNAEITVHTYEMLPVAKPASRAAYCKERFRGDPYVDLLVLPNRTDNESGASWLTP